MMRARDGMAVRTVRAILDTALELLEPSWIPLSFADYLFIATVLTFIKTILFRE
jgi:hypothetical protein